MIIYNKVLKISFFQNIWNWGFRMNTAIISTESDSDFNLILELSRKLNVRTTLQNDDKFETNLFRFFSESWLSEWDSPEDDEAWKSL